MPRHGGFILKPANAYTTHSIQGLSFDTPVVIFNATHPIITRKWLWVALTRARTLSDIRFCHDLQFTDDIKNMSEKIDSYRITDEAKGCVFNDETQLIKPKEIREKIVRQLYSCYHCKNPLSLDYNHDDLSQWSVDRIDNNGYHTSENTVISCLSCNHSKK